MDFTPSVPPAPPSTPAPPAGGGPLSPTRAIGGGWAAFKANPWISLGVCLVLGAVLVVGQMIPFVNLLFGLLVSPALYAGGAWFFLRGIRGENPSFETAFEGFQRWPAATGAVLSGASGAKCRRSRARCQPRPSSASTRPCGW